MAGTLTPSQFVAKWSVVDLPERAASQEHFLDLCRMLEQPTPVEHDATGEEYTFEKGVEIVGAAPSRRDSAAGIPGENGAGVPAGRSRGYADVWWRGKFGWEYKRKDKYKTLDDAYRQLCQYREALENPPLLVVCDIRRTAIHTNFTGTRKEVHTIELKDLARPENVDKLRRVFSDPDSFKPSLTTWKLTETVAAEFGKIADDLRQRKHKPHDAAHFLMKCMFCLFAEDVKLLPDNVFTRLLQQSKSDPAKLTGRLTELFAKMRTGGDFGTESIAWFNGGLFDEAPALPLTQPEIAAMLVAGQHDWGAVEPAIFGTLFERSLDPGKRAQIGAHYTSPDDILLIVEPVVMAPLRREWDAVCSEVESLLDKRRRAPAGAAKKKADAAIAKLFDEFLHRLASVRILDPACGSGNFLYMAIQQLLSLEKEVITHAARPEIGLGYFPRVRPTQLHGIEINPYAAELAQVVIWIGYLQWLRDNGFGTPHEPILEALQTIECRDAILDWTPLPPREGAGGGSKRENSTPLPPRPAIWPDADFIIGNPPFLGSKVFRQNGLDDDYIAAIYAAYDLPKTSDLCCYWFEQARRVIERVGGTEARSTVAVEAGTEACSTGAGKAGTEACPTASGKGRAPKKRVGQASVPAGGRAAAAKDRRTPRVGLLATQGIRGGDNRTVLERIKQTGDIFMAWSDRDWILDGANVHVSMVGFDDGTELVRLLDGRETPTINADLTSQANVASARPLLENCDIAYMGTTKGGDFDLEYSDGRAHFRSPNPHGRSNSDVIVPWINGSDVNGRNRGMLIIDFGVDTNLSEACKYALPFKAVELRVKPKRSENRRQSYADKWWLHVETRPALRGAIAPLPRFLMTCRVAKHRIFAWFPAGVLPDSATFAFARSDDYFFGVLHSAIHELWARRMGTQLREAESGFRYTPTTCFETFPLPWPPGKEPAAGTEVCSIEEAGTEACPTVSRRAATRQEKVGQASVPASSVLAGGTPDDQAPILPGKDWHDFTGYRRHLPHWRLKGATYLLTWRLAPKRPELTPEERAFVLSAIRHFDGQRYVVYAAVVMNDHVHVLFKPLGDHQLSEITHSWKSFTVSVMQKGKAGSPRRVGVVWQDESFDRVVRDEEEFSEKLYYILNNPVKRWPEWRDYPWVHLHASLAADLGFVKAGTEACTTAPRSAATSQERVGQASVPAFPISVPAFPISVPAFPISVPAFPISVPAAGAAEWLVWQRISDAARELNEQRERWLNPPEWIESLGQQIDALDRFDDVPADARPLIRWSAIMAAAARDSRFKKRTLTNLYNERPTWLRLAHEKLDRAVLAAYALVDPEGGWSEDWAEIWAETGAGQPLPDDAGKPHCLAARRTETDQRVLANLLRMNLSRAGRAG